MEFSEAFSFLDEYFSQVNDDPESGSPDEAFDWIFMMEEDDWAALTMAWTVRPSGWRRECAYILGSGPVAKTLPFLATAVFDPDFDVAVEAALSYSNQVLESENTVSVTPEILTRLRQLRDLLGVRKYDELEKLLAISPASHDSA